MYQNEKLGGLLNDLVRINHDRIKGYEHAIEELGNGNHDLKTVFQEKISQSKMYVNKLESYVRSQGETPAEDTTVSGKLYRVWMDFKASLASNDRTAVLNSCVFGEKAALDEYDSVLSADTDLPSDVLQILVEQRDTIRRSHASIKSLAEMQEQLVG